MHVFRVVTITRTQLWRHHCSQYCSNLEELVSNVEPEEVPSKKTNVCPDFATDEWPHPQPDINTGLGHMLQERQDCTSHNYASPPASAANEQHQRSAPQANAAAPEETNRAFSVSCEIDRDKTAVAAAAVGLSTTGTTLPDRAKAGSDCTDALYGGAVLESNPPETYPNSPGMGQVGCSWHRAAPDSPRSKAIATWTSLPEPLYGAPSRAETYMAKEEADGVSPDMRIKSKVYKKLWWQMAHGCMQENIVVSVVHPSHQGGHGLRVNSLGQSLKQVMVQGRWNRHLTEWYRQRDGQQAVVLRLAHPVCLVLEVHATHCGKPTTEPWNKEMCDTTKHTFDSCGLVCTQTPGGREWDEPAGGPSGCLVTNGVFVYTADMGNPRYLTQLEVIGVPLYDFIPVAPRGLTAQSHRLSTPGSVSLMAMVAKPLALPRSRWWLSEIHQRICKHHEETSTSDSPMIAEEECLDSDEESGHYSLGQSSCDVCDCIGEYTGRCPNHDLEGGYMAANLDRATGSIGGDFWADDRVVRNAKGPFRTEVW